MHLDRPYHHGALKQTLVDAAIALIAEVGTHGFTLREVARRAGVSHNAPYRQDVVTLGVAGALMGGVVTASALLHRNLISTLAKSPPKKAAQLHGGESLFNKSLMSDQWKGAKRPCSKRVSQTR